MNNFHALMAKLKLDSHHRIEQFGLSFFIVILLMIILLSTIIVKKTNDDKEELTVRSLYTTEFNTSLTGTTGDVIGVYKGEDNKRVLLLLKFHNPAKISIDAKTYQGFITGAKLNKSQVPLQSNPQGTIYMFGSTGYMGVCFTDPNGFGKQIYDLVIRCNKQVAEKKPKPEGLDNTQGESFTKNDQFRIYFNPGADDVQIAKSLNGDNSTTTAIYNELILAPREAVIREELDKSLAAMQTDLVAIDEYKDRLIRQDVYPVSVPELIRNDEVIANDKGELSLKTSHVLATGYNFDWRSHGISEGGYINDLMGNSTDYTKFFMKKNAEVNSVPFSTARIEWCDSKGEVYDLSLLGSADVKASITGDITLLTTAWQTYYSNKSDYQCKKLKSLLLLDVEANDVTKNCTIHEGETALIEY